MSSATSDPALSGSQGIRRIPELDGLRGIAIMMVLLYHLFPAFFPIGWSGVDLFFILSGYLITSILRRAGSGYTTLRSFYVRRILRIWPVYYLSLIVVVVLNFSAANPSGGCGLGASAVFLQFTDQYLHPHTLSCTVPLYFVHSWSLAVEEQFYLLWPLLLLWLKPSFRNVAIASVALLLVSSSLRFVASGTFELLLATRWDGLIYGVLLAYLQAETGGVALSQAWRRWIYAAAAIIGTAAFAWIHLVHSHGARAWAPQITAVSLAHFGIVGYVLSRAGSPALAVLRGRTICWIGGVSFALYMYHPVIGELVLRAMPTLHDLPYWASASLVSMLFFIAAHFSQRFLEGPALRLKRFFPYSEKTGAKPDARWKTDAA
jgi:peptidoglycan/LPS O-acetylase OafA/YrhL